jgi:hypothetical protein
MKIDHTKLEKYYKNWTFHNIVAHPLSEVFHLLGWHALSDWIHDVSVPDHAPGTGRG